MLLQSCSQYREIHSHVHSLHKNHTQKKKSTANWDQIPSPTRKQGTTTGFISHFAKKKTNPDELYSETWKPPAWKAAKPCLSSVTPCGVARPSPCILSSSEMQQFSAKTGKKMKKSTCTSPHARPESWLSRDWLSEQLERKMGGKKRGKFAGKSLHDQSSPTGSATSTAQQHHSFSTYRLHVQGQKGTQQLQYFRGTQVKQI